MKDFCRARDRKKDDERERENGPGKEEKEPGGERNRRK